MKHRELKIKIYKGVLERLKLEQKGAYCCILACKYIDTLDQTEVDPYELKLRVSQDIYNYISAKYNNYVSIPSAIDMVDNFDELAANNFLLPRIQMMESLMLAAISGIPIEEWIRTH